MEVEPESQRFLRQRLSAHVDAIQAALKPLLEHPPRPALRLWWDGERRLWRSAFAVAGERPPELRAVFERTGYGCLAAETNIMDAAAAVGLFTSLAVVDGNPAISYLDLTNFNLKYVRASDAGGGAWATPVTVDTGQMVGWYTSLAVVSGNPAISYYDVDVGDLKYVRAADATGSMGGTPIVVDTAGDVGENTSLTVVDGNPAISYYRFDTGDLKYVHAANPAGTAWTAPVDVDTDDRVGAGTSLAVVDGHPAISYLNATHRDLKYSRAADAQHVFLPITTRE